MLIVIFIEFNSPYWRRDSCRSYCVTLFYRQVLVMGLQSVVGSLTATTIVPQRVTRDAYEALQQC